MGRRRWWHWRVLRSLRVPGAWLGAALWALHPLQVETTAWITEMKNTQSGLSYLLTILFFVKGLREREKDDPSIGFWNYALTLLCAALAMASKSSTVVLPLVLCLCAWWVEGRWHWRHMMQKWGRLLLWLSGRSGPRYRSGRKIWTEPMIRSRRWSWPERFGGLG